MRFVVESEKKKLLDGAYYGDYSELVYLRARHYAPGMGLFLTRDTWMGDYSNPLSLNKWLYVAGNPVSQRDPSGHCYIDDLNEMCPPTPDISKYNEKVKPSGITFTGSDLPAPIIIYNRNCINEYVVEPGTSQSQFIPSRCEPDWFLDKDRDGNDLPYHSGLCGHISVAAILALLKSGITVNNIVDDFMENRPNVAPDNTGSRELGDFINNYYSNSLYAWTTPTSTMKVDHWGGYDSTLHLLQPDTFIIAGIRINGSNGQLRNGQNRPGVFNNPFTYSGIAKHWVVVTGTSHQWDRFWSDADLSPWKWVRIFNSFNNQTEYYWWADLKSSWTAESGSMLRVDIR